MSLNLDWLLAKYKVPLPVEGTCNIFCNEILVSPGVVGNSADWAVGCSLLAIDADMVPVDALKYSSPGQEADWTS